jgi:hypothetical protein
MKKFLLIHVFLFCAYAAFAQKVASKPTHVLTPYNTSHLRLPTDTLWGQLDQWESAIYIPLETGGYLAGNNGFGDLQKAQAFQIQNQFILEKCILWFGAKKLESNNPNSNLEIKVLTLNGPGINAQGATPNMAPNTVLGTTTLPATAIDTAQGFWNIVTFGTPVTINGNFAVSVDFSTLADGDTATLVHSDDGQGNVFNDLSWEQQSDNVWVSFAYDGPGGWGIDVQLGIFPIGEEVVGIDKSGNQSFKLYPVFPNPISGNGYIFYELNVPAKVSVEIMDMTGKVLATYEQGDKPVGKSMLEIDASGLNNGTYLYGIRIQDQVMFKKLVIAK